MKTIDLIDRGGFGFVERVELDDGTIVARKTFSPSPALMSADVDLTKLKKRFAREVRVQRELPPEIVIPVLDFDLDVEAPWFTMPLADSNYADEIERQRDAGAIEAEPLSAILNALEELHSLGYVHRDLNPRNILLHDGSWKLADLGLVMPKVGSTTKLTSSNSAWGTDRYTAPEQLLKFREAKPAADIYSFGCILHDLFGDGERIPYQRYTAEGPIGPVIERCTALTPDKRFKSIETLHGVLMDVLEQGPEVVASAAADEWLTRLDDVESWDSARLAEFISFLGKASSPDTYAIGQAITNDVLRTIYELDEDEWRSVAQYYCDFASTYSFKFSYCDVVIRRLVTIFELGELPEMSAAVLAAARMGSMHNRWFVMGQVVKMAGPLLDDDAAQRIAIELKAEEAEDDFERCARVIHEELDAYHPRIAAAVAAKDS